MVMKPDKHQRSKHRCQIYFGRSTTVHNLLFSILTPCTSYVLCRVKAKKSEQKHTRKNFVGFPELCLGGKHDNKRDAVALLKAFLRFSDRHYTLTSFYLQTC